MEKEEEREKEESTAKPNVKKEEDEEEYKEEHDETDMWGSETRNCDTLPFAPYVDNAGQQSGVSRDRPGISRIRISG